MPRPGPISNTWSLGLSSANATILRTMLGSIRKFWPSRLFGGGRSAGSTPVNSRRKDEELPAPACFAKIGKRGSEIVDEIGKLFHQVIGKRRPRLQGGKLLPFFLAQGLSDERTRPALSILPLVRLRQRY